MNIIILVIVRASNCFINLFHKSFINLDFYVLLIQLLNEDSSSFKSMAFINKSLHYILHEMTIKQYWWIRIQEKLLGKSLHSLLTTAILCLGSLGRTQEWLGNFQMMLKNRIIQLNEYFWTGSHLTVNFCRWIYSM